MKEITKDNINEIQSGTYIVSFYEIAHPTVAVCVGRHPRKEKTFVFCDSINDDEYFEIDEDSLIDCPCYDEKAYYLCDSSDYLERTEFAIKLMEKHLEFLKNRVQKHKEYYAKQNDVSTNQ